ncbi:MAG: thioredoxin [Oscillospiraceae bacterium]|nr:thioredoxin [Oscillospiraceae bacterium]
MSNPYTVQLSAADFTEAVLKSPQPVLVDFWAPWCGPCRALAPVIDALAEKYAGRARVGKLNVDDEGALAAQYGVMSIPTVVLFKDGKEVERTVGLRGQEDFEALLNSVL